MDFLDGSIGVSTLALLSLCLAIALGFEFVNGFHDTANAVATVIYTRSLKPLKAVVWSGFMNFLGVLFGGAAVAFSIVHLLPVDLLINIGKTAGLLMVLSLLLSAILWNLGTWYFGLPASSSHALIGSILGVGLASSLFSDQGFGTGVNWVKAREVGLSLLISPLVGFCLAGGLLLLSKAFINDRRLYQAPKSGEPPPFWIRAILLLTCTGVSFAHGSNDGQKGVGLIMLILIGILPVHYAVNGNLEATQISRIVAEVQQMDALVGRVGTGEATSTLQEELRQIRAALSDKQSLTDLSPSERSTLRASILGVDEKLGKFEVAQGAALSMQDRTILKTGRAQLRKAVDFVVTWVVIAVALALGVGTTVGWKRIVVTVGEKIGKTHLTYAQGASAELIAMSTIAGADLLGLPVSTTHVLSSGVAGTMAANQSGLQLKTVRAIATAWLLTLPVTILLSGTLFSISAGSSMKEIGKRAAVQTHQERVLRKLE
jgi:inorganic phosphate transporter, PiT family